MMYNSASSGNVSSKLRPELRDVFNKALKDNNKFVNNLYEIKKLGTWYKEAKKDPKEIPSLVANVILEQILEHVNNYLGHSISAKVSIQEDRFVIKEIGIDFSVKPYVKFTKKIDGAKSSEIKITFDIRMTGKMENISFKNDYNGKVVTIAKLASAVTISLVGIEMTLVVVPAANLLRPLELCRNRLFEATNVLLVIPSRNKGSPLGSG